jgi:hypothetical protein
MFKGSDLLEFMELIVVSHKMIFLSHKPKWLYHTGFLSHRFSKK